MATLLLTLLFFPQENLERMLAAERYLDAAELLRGPARALDSPEAVRRYTVFLVEYHAHQIAFRSFFAKNLEAGDRLRELRGTRDLITGGDYQIVEQDLEQLLLAASEKFPDAADIELAKAVYVFNGTCCFIDPKVRMTQAQILGAFTEAEARGIVSGSILWGLALDEMARPTPNRTELTAYLERARSLMPRNPDVLAAYVDDLLLRKRFEAAQPHARQLFEIAISNDEKVIALTRVARTNLGLQRIDDALIAVRAGLDLNPGHQFLFVLGLEALREKRDEQAYAAHLDTFLSQNPDGPGPFRIYLAYLAERGITALDEGFMEGYAEGEDATPLAAVTRQINLVLWFELTRRDQAFIAHLDKAENLALRLAETPEPMRRLLETLRQQARSMKP